jgi:hypothetical protein
MDPDPGSMTLTNGSGSGSRRHKNIRIRKTGFNAVSYVRKGKGRRGVGGGGGGQERGGKEERRYLTIGYLGELTRDQEETFTRSPLRECQNIHANVKRYVYNRVQRFCTF